MGKPGVPVPALLFVGVLYREEEYFSRAKKKLYQSFGESLFESPSTSWDYSQYYRSEFGSPLFRSFVFFRDTISPEALCDIKLVTNDIEADLASAGKRRVNLDPGYLTPYNVVLASTKNYAHRICIGKGIYAEVTLLYSDGKYRPHIFTYRDYASDECAALFARARTFLKQ